MSLYAFTTSALQGIMRSHWGRPYIDPEGNRHDPGVQEFVDELIARLASQAPIDLAGDVKINTNGFQILVDNNTIGDPPINPDPPLPPGASGSVVVLADVTVSSATVDTSGLSIVVDSSALDISITVDGCDVTAEITGEVTAELTGTATVTVNLSKTYTTLTFVDGIFQGAS